VKIAFQYTAAFVAAVLVASLLASAFSTQFVIANLLSIGVDVTFETRLAMTARDFSILQTLGLVVAASFLVAFIIAGGLTRWVGGNRTFWYVFAGTSSIVCLLMLMSLQLQLMPIAGARSNLGLAFQAFAGGCGGWLFSILIPHRTSPT